MKRRNGLFLVARERQMEIPPESFSVGEAIPATGIYRVYHYAHRLNHDVTLLKGEQFPPCAGCGDRVRFELLKAAPEIAGDANFRVRLYRLDCPDDALVA